MSVYITFDSSSNTYTFMLLCQPHWRLSRYISCSFMSVTIFYRSVTSVSLHRISTHSRFNDS